ncbi:UDP-N-acetylglucosamine 2-epimerase (non-hydrolyzing) [candidate division TA06 bacterium]|uniref:UDP-N-acetylglucosamine 2-epimerase (Non-hydrolyzing) n=1 Tax=candidate division TA06 bacterium TaxID=2250710 RepID=A0A660SC59_UNCT6|nr:MAG: UDP-N-acetylglucosamine 2-epimerase (non-hydrolyzing) [candidate division TA06 bacterium]
MKKIFIIVGARPNFIKVAPLMRILKGNEHFETILVHSGQHYDYFMSKVFFEELDISEPDYYLNVGSGSQGYQTAEIIKSTEELLERERPDLIIVVGDVNTTMASTIAASKLYIKTAHIEAGLRSYDRTMPEEINRIITDSLSDLLFTHSRGANVNLEKEGIDKDKIFFVGNIMIDTIVNNLDRIKNREKYKELGLERGNFILLTMHRPSNVDVKETFMSIVDALDDIGKRIPIVFPIHPRTDKMAKQFGIDLNEISNMKIIEPISYIDLLSMENDAKCIITDSGGIQEESTFLNIPCFTIRENTERPITAEVGSNTIVGTDKNAIVDNVMRCLDGECKYGEIPELWDGQTAKRIVEVIEHEID